MSDDFAKEVRELYSEAEEADRENYDEAVTDLKFEGFDQWDERVRNYRESLNPPLPCLTINTVQQYTSLVVGDWLTNETAITVLPREDGDVNIAQVRSELIRSIELQSKASRIYASCLGQSAGCGISNFRVNIEDAYEDAFVRDIFIRDIPNPLAVLWDPLAFDATARDATFCFVGDKIKTTDYKKLYPKAALPSLIQREAGSSWSDGKTVTLPEYWKMTEKVRTIGMTATGKTVDLTDVPKKKWPQLAIDPDTNQPIINDKAKCKYAVRVMTNGMEQLDDPYEVKVHRLPIIRVLGREVWSEGKRVRFGLTRCLRDSQRMRNYIRSIRAELLAKFPRANFMGPASAFEGISSDFGDVLKWNDGAGPVQQITTQNLGALLNEESIYAQDMMDTTGIHEASRGMPSNEASGIAIQARQQEGDIATQIYHHHMTQAQQEAGEVINAYVPIVFDTARTIRTVGPDLSAKMVRVNDPNDPDSVDIGLGRYDVTVATGPRYQTMRQRTAQMLMELSRADPQLMQIAGDKIIKAIDAPEADEIAERIKRTIPPNILGDDADQGKDPEELAQQQQKAAEAQQVQQMGLQLEMQAKEADTRLKVAQAEKAEAEAAKSKIEAMQLMGGQSDPSVDAEQQRTAIMGFDAVTRRIAALEKGNAPGTPPLLAQHLAPVIANAVGQALAKHLGFAPVELGLPDVSQLPQDIPPEQDQAA